MRLYVLIAFAIASASAAAEETDGGTPRPAEGELAETPALRAHDAALRAQILKEAQTDADAKIKKAKDELRDEIRAEMVTAGASAPSEFEQLPMEKPKLSFLELDGYYRLRPNLYDNLWLGWTAPDGLGYWPFPKPFVNTNDKTIISSDMRFRIEPTFNVSEDIKIKSQFDVLDNVVLGSTPAGPYSDLAAGGGYQAVPLFANSLNPPTAADNVLENSIVAKRIWAEVMTPVGQLRFGRMGSNWGLGIFQNDGNCLDCDFGNTVDRLMFVAKIAGHYVIPFVDFISSGPLANPYAGDELGQPVALDHDLEAYEYGLVVAKKDTDEELRRHKDEGSASLNYGFYGVYRNVGNELMYGNSSYPVPGNGPCSPGTQTVNGTNSLCATNFPTAGTGAQATSLAGTVDVSNANIFTPDLWFRYMTKRLRVEAEAVYVYGQFNTLWDPTDTVEHQITMNQFAGAAVGEYHFLPDGALTIGFEAGTASGENAPGLINDPSRNNQPEGLRSTPAGSLGGRQFDCTPDQAGPCTGGFNAFTFSRDYHVDMILWREILGGVTGAWYARPSAKYQITDGLDASLRIIYSQAWYSAATPGGQLPLGVEFDGGIHYETDDGFLASVDYGLLVPLGGLGETVGGTVVNPSIAQAVRVILGVKY